MNGFAVSRRVVRGRLILTFCVTAALVFYLVGRLAWIQILRSDELYEQAWQQWNHNLPVSTSRGSIYDRHGRLLAGSIAAETVAAVPARLEDPRGAAEALAPVLEMDPQEIIDLIALERNAVYLKRKVAPAVAETIREMNIPGIVFFDEDKRYYPGGNLASQLLGFVGMDQGWAGLELYYEQELAGGEGLLFYPADGRGKQLPHDFDRHLEPRQARDLRLSLDETIQHIVEQELDQIMAEAAPRQAMALMVDPWTGAVLAAASRPDYNPEGFDQYDPDSWNLAPITASFEPGSTFKLVTLAGVIEEGLFDPHQTHHCPGYSMVAGEKIHCWTSDRGGHGTLTFYEALADSCNPAFIELSGRLGREKLTAYIEAFGFGRQTGIDYPGESAGLVFEVAEMGPLELATASFGQGPSVTAIQQAMAVAAMVNGGYLYLPYLVEEISGGGETAPFHRNPEPVRQVISAETSAMMVELMENVILEGTGHAAALEGYRVAGKTGTAEKVGPDSEYISDQFIYSLVGFAPVDAPRVVLFVAVDGVTRGPRLGVYTSAPLFGRIMEKTLQYLQVKPTEVNSLPDPDA